MPKDVLQYAMPAGPGRNLAQKAATGFFWLMAQTLGSKLVNMAGQVVLAWLLSPEDFGLVGLAYTVTAFANLIHQSGLREILIHRHAKFDRWANPAFWMSLTLGCVAALVMVVAAPVAAWLYGERELIGLVLVLAIATPFNGLDIVPDARLTSELHFRYLAMVRWVTAVGTMGLSVLFARLHLGAYSFVVPQPIMLAVRLVMLWSAARIPIRWGLHFRRWKYLLGDSAMLFLASFFVMLTWQGDYMVLGIMHDPKTVGIYFFAFNLSIQTMAVFTSNMAGVLFPALSKLQADPAHQTRAFLQAAQLLAMIGVPLCLLQAALAGPGICVFFVSWWYPAIRVLQLLSIGMAVRLVASPGGSLMQAQGRFRAYLLTNAANALVFLALVTAGSMLGKGLEAAVYVAAAVMIYFTIIGPVFLHVAIRPGGGTWADVWRVYWAPFVAGGIATAAGVAAGRACVLALGDVNAIALNLVRIVVISLVTLPLYVVIVRRLNPAAWQSLRSRVVEICRSRLPRFFPRPANAPVG